MKQLFEYLVNRQYDALIIKEEANIIAGEQINEAFKSSIIQKLAQAIYNAEKENNKRKVEKAKEDDERYPLYGGGKRNPELKNFASIFGPKTEGGRYNTKKGLQGLKWSEITDDDFKVYEPTDKELIKLIKKSYGKKDGNADFIVIDNKDNVINFIKAYGKDPKEDGMFYFKAPQITKYGSKIPSEVKELTQSYYTYQTRGLKTNEVIDALKALSTIGGIKVYALEITEDMIKDYKTLHTSREESRKGVINFDKASLDMMLRNQQARYKTMVAEIKAKKLQKDPNVLFDEIKATNDKVVALYKKIMSKPEYLDEYFDLGRIMQYVSGAYESFYRSMKKTREADKYEKRAIDAGEAGERAKRYRHYSDEESQVEINNAKEYVEKVNKMIEEIESKL